jgi:mannan endo-1,4-beta-mannosidase
VNNIPPQALGVFPADDLSEAIAFNRWVKNKLSVVITFIPVDVSPYVRKQFVNEYLDDLWKAGFVPIVTLEPWSIEEISSSKLLKNNNLREQFRAWANQFAKWIGPSSQRKLILRPAHEMNGSWYPWSADAGVNPVEYRRMWRAVYDIFQDKVLCSDDIRWLWSINAETTADVDVAAYYPGDAYVDWVGVDGYNFGGSQDWSVWRNPESVFERAFKKVRNISDAPLSVPEFGCSSIRDGNIDPVAKSSWVADTFELFNKWNVRLASWFNINKETDWRVLDFATNADRRYPDKISLNGTDFVIYPSFREAAVQYVD